MAVNIFGIRHHGPGSARNLTAALHNLRPDIVLIEGPPEGDPLLSWAVHEDMKPPVALLAYVPENPQQAVFYPFTEYSPEWNAIKYALINKIPVRFIDIPLSNKLAAEKKEDEDQPGKKSVDSEIRRNPISYLAEIAGFDDAEEWWEHEFELRKNAIDVFDAVTLSMTGLREAFPDETKDSQIREAFMRRGIRKAQRELYENIAVVCGAWHVPALKNMSAIKEDDALLKDLPKTKIDTAWIPWTNNRLSVESGYGAGVDSPGWYQHIWNTPNETVARWLSLTARVFRNHKIDISPAHIIEAVRLSEALKELRNLTQPGLKEQLEATQAVMCMGDAVRMQLVWKDLIIGTQMGSIPAGTPQAPIQTDFEKQARSLRLKIVNEAKTLSLDLRQPDHLQKSILLHRLLVLNIPWGSILTSSGKGTFKEDWLICWEPEMTINLLEKAFWGNTIETAANHYIENFAQRCTSLAEITETVQKALPAELDLGIKAAMEKMDELAASTSDTPLLMAAFIPLVAISRYSNVRNTDVAIVSIILRSVFYRMVSNIATSVSNINEEQAAEMSEKIRKVQEAILLLDDATYHDDWLTALNAIIEMKQAEAIIHGSCCKILYDSEILTGAQMTLALNRALSVNNDPNYSSNWIEGFLKDGAVTLLFDDTIWEIINSWIQSLNEESFVSVLPLLRRTFSSYNSTEKQKIGSRVLNVRSTSAMTAVDPDFNKARAESVFPILEKLMGLK